MSIQRRVVLREGVHSLTINADKMNFGTQLRVETAVARNPDNAILAILQYNLFAWDGPALDGTPCTPIEVERLDITAHPDLAPLMARAMEAIAAANPQLRPAPEDSDPNLLTPTDGPAPAPETPPTGSDGPPAGNGA